MSDAFNTALQQAKQMYRPERQDVSVVEIQLGMAGGGGLYPLIKRQGGGYARDPGGSGPWDAWSPPDEPRIQYQPVPQQATVPDMSSGMMRSYFQNLVGEEEEGYNPLYRKEGGGLSSIQKQINIGGEPHRLAYINPDKASLLQQMGGSGKSVNGVPAYFWDVGDDPSGAGWDVGKDTDRGTDKGEGGDNISREDGPKQAKQKSPGFLETVYQHFLPARMTPRELDEEQARHNRMADLFSGIAYGTDRGPAGWSGYGVGRKGGGGLSSIQKQIDIGGEPHRLSYINSDEASLLKQLGGSGRNVNGVPAYYFDDQGFSESWSDPGDTDLGSESAWSDVEANEAEQAAAVASIAAGAAAPGYASDIPVLSPNEVLSKAAIMDVDPSRFDQKVWDPTYFESSLGMNPKEKAANLEAHKRFKEAQQEKVDALNRYYSREAPVLRLGIDILESKYEKIEGSPNIRSIEEWQKDTGTDNPFFGVEKEDGTVDWYGPLGRQKDEEDPWEFWQPNPLAYAVQSQTVHGVGAPKTLDETLDTMGAGISGSAMGTMDPEAPESYAHAQQLALEEMWERREKEEAELEKFNRYRVALGREERDEPVGGWKNPEPYSDPLVGFLGAVSWFMRQGLPFYQAFNAAQRRSGSGEHGMEIRSMEDQIAGGSALYGLTGYAGPALNREQQAYEKAKEEEWLAGEKFAESLPGDQQITPLETKEEEAEKVKKLSLMAKFFAEDDEEEKKKIWDGFTKDEKKLIEIAYGEKGLPSLMDQIG